MVKSMFLNDKEVSKHFSYCLVENLKTDCVYLFDFKNLDKIYKENNFKQMPPNSIGVHWYGGHPDSQKMNNKLNHETWKAENNTYTEILKYLEDVDGVV